MEENQFYCLTMGKNCIMLYISNYTASCCLTPRTGAFYSTSCITHIWAVPSCQMKKQISLVIILVAILSSCTPKQFPDATKTPPTASAVPTEEFTRKNDFGDGYVAHIPIDDVTSETPEAIVKILVTQWLEHYKTGSTAERAMIKDFQLGEVTLLERKEPDPSVVASVWFSIVPTQIPNDWASFPGDEIKPEDKWWRLAAPFGVYQDPDYYWLKLVFGRGT